MTRDDLGRLIAVVLGLLGILLFLAAEAVAVGPVVSPATCGLAWEAPTTNTNATPLTDLARYEVQIGTAPGVFPTAPVAVGAAGPIPAPGVVTWPCAGVTDGQRYARVRACDLAGNCSAWTVEVPFVYDAVAPSPPTNLRVGP